MPIEERDDLKLSSKNINKSRLIDLKKEEVTDKKSESEKLFLKKKEMSNFSQPKVTSNRKQDLQKTYKKKTYFSSEDKFEESKLEKIHKVTSDKIRLKEIDKITKLAEKESKELISDNQKNKKLDSLKYTPEERDRGMNY